jgi:hypothetical protein
VDDDVGVGVGCRPITLASNTTRSAILAYG